MKNLLIILCVGIIGTMLVVGCGSKEGGAKSDLKKMLEHMKAGEAEKAIEYMDFDGVIAEMKKEMEGMDEATKKMMGDRADPDKVIAKMKEGMKEDESMPKFEYEIGEATVDGDTVKIKVKVTPEGEEVENLTVVMNKKDGKWKADLASMKPQDKN